ncbi:N-acetylmuramoyl-L-alanine amidase [Paraliobacillus salinarum]|uniref:N-acetylmuramoyl-L-alanine amidase n=1 Tax=Paraliobacillus salinarum TaxID=1158996 RepID=UPI0015F42AC7|nr:N-acetylmuramoyl-L-alanine amidase [Paraliobacillus salinarum]
MKQPIKWIWFLVFTIFIVSFSNIVYAANVNIKANDLRVRNGPGLDYEVIGEVNEGETYTYIDEKQEWIEIEYSNGTGWVAKEFIEIEKRNNQNSEQNEKNTSESEEIVLTDKAESEILTTNLKQKVIVIDAGHGGRDIGATGRSDLYEKDYTLETAHNIKNYLEQLGAIVHLTRSDDRFISLTPRSSYANFKEADVFLSIHYNSTPQYPSANGIGTYYYDDKDKLLATYVHEGLIESTGSDDRAAQFGDFQVLRTNHTPSLLLELGFISNASEEERIQTNTYQQKLSRGIIAGLQRYFFHSSN